MEQLKSSSVPLLVIARPRRGGGDGSDACRRSLPVAPGHPRPFLFSLSLSLSLSLFFFSFSFLLLSATEGLSLPVLSVRGSAAAAAAACRSVAAVSPFLLGPPVLRAPALSCGQVRAGAATTTGGATVEPNTCRRTIGQKGRKPQMPWWAHWTADGHEKGPPTAPTMTITQKRQQL
ncbi:hypothetical protein TW95_gp1697 [Pandoravirus inopinatum]|uniref:Uncharacterized protein n=1 Tax=Pandoravirus inopinatum TaxID=1605721 RepID=A0A0B5JBM8_9VIRU|nr:hypothetical protein TW95_gp1697 [Pandoravirus inopinatum]AJF98431.1 hypothetical protein [Pandoravirus inopinatum]